MTLHERYRERERERITNILRGELERGTLDKKAIKFIHGISFWSEMIFFLSDNAVSQIMSFSANVALAYANIFI